ncbi:MAG: inositol monophosphatase family protein [Shinella zoogloeoides]|uniref:inositol monophosphatase family protein n=1 Tax=Shinella zoogloeoides TaxID=352475 RepID=UPI003C71A2DE
MGRDKHVLDGHLELAVELADVAHGILVKAIDSTLAVEVKPDRSLVTQIDLEIERRMRTLIADRFPAHGIIGEEDGTENGGASHIWVLDPVDGTAQLIAGMPVYGTLIALAIDGVPSLGVIDIPAIGARWIGAVGRQTMKNGRPVKVRSCNSLSSAILTNSNQDYLPPNGRPVLDALREATGARVYGGSCLNYGILAEGRTDLALDGGQKVHDFAPFRPIVEGAGGIVTDWQGLPLTLESSGNLLGAGDPDRHREALAIIAECHAAECAA